MEVCSTLCGSLEGSKVWGKMDPCIWMAESLHSSPEIIITLLIDYTLIQNKKFKILFKFLRLENKTLGFHY